MSPVLVSITFWDCFTITKKYSLFQNPLFMGVPVCPFVEVL